MPPNPSRESANGIGHGVPWIASRAGDVFRADPLDDDGPNNYVQCNFRTAGETVVAPNFEQSMHKQQWGQCTRDDQAIVEMVVQKRPVQMRFEQMLVDAVRGATQQKKWISKIKKPRHR